MEVQSSVHSIGLKPVDKAHILVLNGSIFLSMLKNHLKLTSYALGMPPIYDEWFLTFSKF